jgi:4-hydroxyphenylacetate 3-monooxygenase
MRTGADYREAMRDGRRVFVMGEGRVDDVTTHPATAAMIDEYVHWYDRHFDPAWAHIVLGPEGAPVSFTLPRSSGDLVRMGKSYSATTFPTAGNVTHTPAYGHIISMGILIATHEHGHAESIARAKSYREMIAKTGRFLTFCGGAPPLGIRLRPDPAERVALKVVKKTDAGVILTGKVGMHTSPAYAEDVYIGSLNGAVIDGRPASFVVPVGGKGVTTLCRKTALRDPNKFNSPLSSRFDELDGQLWLDDVFVPWEHVFLVDPGPEAIARYLLWHHLYGWLAKAEFTLGLALALSDAMALKEHEPTIEYIVDIVAEVATVRACLTAAERDPSFTPEGYCTPNYQHLMPGGIAIFRAHQRISELLRALPGSSLVVMPSDSDLADPEIGAGLDECFGGGGYTALQRSALLQLAWDHVASALDGRESSFELHASGGMPAWRGRLRRAFDRYNTLANGVLNALDIQMPEIDVSSIKERPLAPRRVNTAPPAEKPR